MHECQAMKSSHVTQLSSLYTEMKNRAKETTCHVSLGEGREGRWLLDSQHVHIWQSFAQGWPTQRHCVPVIAALQQQMKLSAGRWLYSDSRSALSLQSVANKYVGFQSCQGRRWTVGQGAKRRAKAFPSPRNLFSMSLVTSPGHPFSVSHPKGPRAPDLTHCLPGEFCEPPSLSLSSLFLPLSSVDLCVCHVGEPEIASAERNNKNTEQLKVPFLAECVSVWWGWSDLSSLTQCEKETFLYQVSRDEKVTVSSSERHAGRRKSTSLYFCCLDGADRPSAVWELLFLLSPPFFHLVWQKTTALFSDYFTFILWTNIIKYHQVCNEGFYIFLQ